MLHAARASSTSTWRIDEARSYVEFSIFYLAVKEVTGRFSGVRGTLRADPADLSRGWVEASLDPATIDTGIPDRDRSLRSKGFLEVNRYPVCTYRSRRVVPTPEGQQQLIQGDLVLHGVKAEVDLLLESRAVSGMAGNRSLRVEARASINRKQFQIHWRSALDAFPWLIGHRVDLRISLEGRESV